MKLGAALAARLEASSEVMAIVGTGPKPQIYWIQRPQGTELPAIVMRMAGGTEEETIDDDDADFMQTNVTVDCFGHSNVETKSLALAVRNALKPAGTVEDFEFDDSTVSRPIDLGEFGVPGWQHRAALDCVIRHGAES